VELHEEIRQQLTGPGGPFEVHEEQVLGETMQVFKDRQRSIRELLAISAAHGDAEYIVHGDRRISYAEHVRLVASVARALSERYGIGPGDRVAILAANSAEWVISFWAVTSLGGIVAALNGLWTADEIQYAVELAEPKLLIGDARRLARIEGLDLGVPTLEIESDFSELEEYAPDAELPDTHIDEDDRCLILFTSGTTGRPKGAVVTHRALVGFVRTQTLHGLERLMIVARQGDAPPAPAEPPPSPCSLVTAPLFHLSGLYASAIMMLAQGAKTVYRSGRFDPEDVMRLMEKERVTIWSALGAAGPQLLAHEALEKYDLSSLRNIGFGGAPTPPDLQRRMQSAFPNARGGLGMGYGLSESGGMGAVIGGADLAARPTSTGRALVAHEIEIRDDENRALPAGETGQIFLRSPYLLLEYWRNEDATRETIQPGRWLATGDIGRLDEEGYLYIDSRARDMILRSGENIYPIEIENRLHDHPDVEECAVVGVDHPELGQEIKAVVVPAANARIDTDALIDWVRETLAAYKVPSVWEVRSEPLPRNAAGKVLKNVLTGDAESIQVEE
jgi:acyl-CoA synthetase (AMP-forming)/AMP-acid ligase II